jgi:hypothetical protein
MGRQLVNQRTECDVTVLNQNSNAQIQQYQIRINGLQQLAFQQDGTLTMRTIQGAQEIT